MIQSLQRNSERVCSLKAN